MFFLFGFISPDVPGVQIDTAIFNAVFIAINIYQIVRLLKKMVPPVLDSKEEIIYERDFKEVFTRQQYKLLLSKSRKDYYSNNISQLCKTGQTFKELIYLAYIHEGYSVILEDQFGKLISILKPGSWIGIIEYSKREIIMNNPVLSHLIKEGELELVWQVSAVIKKTSEVEKMAKQESLKIVEHENYDRNEDQEENEKKVFVGHGSNKQDLKEIIKNDPNANQLDFFVKNRNTGCYVYRFDLEVSYLFIYLGFRTSLQ